LPLTEPDNNDAPVAVNQAYTVNEDAKLTVAAPGVLAGATDADGAASGAAVLVTGVQHGTLSLAADGSFEYTPNADFNGTDSFTYKAKDAQDLESAAATVTITVGAFGDRDAHALKMFLASGWQVSLCTRCSAPLHAMPSLPLLKRLPAPLAQSPQMPSTTTRPSPSTKPTPSTRMPS
jgi:VCBS repeat-containing protein